MATKNMTIKSKTKLDGHVALEIYRTHARPVKRPFALPLSSLIDQAVTREETHFEQGNFFDALRHQDIRHHVEELAMGAQGEP